MIPCVWYVSRTASPFEKSLIGNMASAFRARGGDLSLYVDGGTGDGVDEAYAWGALTGLERAGKVLLSGRALWHLWGEAPVWWPVVRLRARAAHTSLPAARSTAWRGYPSRLFPEEPREGEAILIPTFDSRIAPDDEGPSAHAVHVDMGSASPALRQALEGGDTPVVDLSAMGTALRPSAQSGVLVAGPGPLDALRAASLTMRGLVPVSPSSPALDALLGPEGYFSVPEDTAEAWRRTLELALSEQGRRRATSARHHIKTGCSADRCADSLIAVYRKVLGGQSR